MSELAAVGDFCPNPECEHYGDVEAKNIIRYGRIAMAEQERVVNAFSVKPANRLSMSAKTHCSINAKLMKRIF